MVEVGEKFAELRYFVDFNQNTNQTKNTNENQKEKGLGSGG